MAKSKAKATPKKAAKKAAKKTKAAPTQKLGVPAKLTAVKKAKNSDNNEVVTLANAFMAVSGEDFVSKGALNLGLTACTKAAADTEEARIMVAEAFDDGDLKAYQAKS